MKLLEENIGKIVEDTGIGKEFLDKTTKVEATKSNIFKWDHIKPESFCSAKETITYVKGLCKKSEK
jgi:hypothetical protein